MNISMTFGCSLPGGLRWDFVWSFTLMCILEKFQQLFLQIILKSDKRLILYGFLSVFFQLMDFISLVILRKDHPSGPTFLWSLVSFGQAVKY